MANSILEEVALAGFLARAILADYAETVAKIENVPASEIKDRVFKKADEIRKDFIKKRDEELLNDTTTAQ